jgi:phosphoglycerol transferase MdoB-like AlkP superfamily enzyme
MQSSKRNSFRVDSIARLSGFDRYYGAEDFQTHQHGENKDKMPHYGTWDGDMFNHYFKELDSIKKPFLSFTFTSTTHFPYYLPSKKYEIYPHNNKTINGYFNTMRYTDDMIKDFITKAKKTSWFKDTIFIFIADHTAPITNNEITAFEEETGIKIPNRQLEYYKIPFIIYAPHIFKPQVISKVTSQADILPSLIDFLGFKNNFSTISNSVFTKTNNSFAFSKAGDIYTYITKDGYTQRRTDKNFTNKSKDYSKQILSIHQVFVDSLNKNKFFK